MSQLREGRRCCCCCSCCCCACCCCCCAGAGAGTGTGAGCWVEVCCKALGVIVFPNGSGKIQHNAICPAKPFWTQTETDSERQKVRDRQIHSLTLSLRHTHRHTQTHTHSLSLSLSLRHTPTHLHTLSPSLCRLALDAPSCGVYSPPLPPRPSTRASYFSYMSPVRWYASSAVLSQRQRISSARARPLADPERANPSASSHCNGAHAFGLSHCK